MSYIISLLALIYTSLLLEIETRECRNGPEVAVHYNWTFYGLANEPQSVVL